MTRLDELEELERRIGKAKAIERLQLAEMGKIRDAVDDLLEGYSLPTALAVEVVAASCGVTRADIMAPDRRAEVARARHLVAWLLRDQGLSLPAIGRILDRDHTTIQSSVRRVEGTPSLLAAATSLRDHLRKRAVTHLRSVAS